MKARITTLSLLAAATASMASAQEAAQAPTSFWWGDCDGDGLLDAYAVAPDGTGLLLRNRGDGSFEDVTLSAGLAAVQAATTAAWEDFDCDGDLDLFLGTAFGPAHLMRNLGEGSFEPAQVGIDHVGRDLRAAWIDYDSDGYADLHVHAEDGDRLYHNLGLGLFEPVDLGLPRAAVILSSGPSAPPTEAQPPAPPSEERPSSTSGGSIRTAVGPGPSISSSPAGPHGSRNPHVLCLDSIMDQVNPLNCIGASSVPTLGTLYPLGNEFYVDASGDVGIGTTAPNYRLTVIDDGSDALRLATTAADSSVRVLGRPSGGGLFSIETSSGSNQMAFSTAGTEAMRIADDGEVGIGTSSPDARLHVSGSPVTIQANNSNGGGVAVKATGAGAFGYGVKAEASYETGTGVYGAHTAATGTQPGVHGVTLSGEVGSVGVLGEGVLVGVRGEGSSPLSIGAIGMGSYGGVYGTGTGTTTSYGVWGTSSALTAWGVVGQADSTLTGADNVGVLGAAEPVSGIGVVGICGAGPSTVSISSDGAGVVGMDNGSGYVAGVIGAVDSPDGTGVEGWHRSTSGSDPGVLGVTVSEDSSAGVRGEFYGSASVDVPGVEGISTPQPYYGIGGSFEGGWKGIESIATVTGSGDRIAGRFKADNATGWLIGAYAEAYDPQDDGDAWAIYAVTPPADGDAGRFVGNVEVTGTLSKGGGSFKIDHPLDPANQYLYHSFVESPDMMNIYNGNAILDGSGSAWVELPEWFEALNRDFRYQLTAVGAPAPNLYVAEKIAGNRFRIAGGPSHAEVSWQVTGVRKDAFAEANRIPVEEPKRPEERGLYLHPEALGFPQESGIDHALVQEPIRAKEAASRAAASERKRPKRAPVIERRPIERGPGLDRSAGR